MTIPDDSQQKEPKQDQEKTQLEGSTPQENKTFPKINVRIGLVLAIIGYLFFLLGARPSLFGLDRSRVIGFVQISVFLTGLALITLGSYMTLNALWPDGKKTIAAEIGARLISTGYVICVFTGMADIFGMGSHPLPNVFFGPLQARGMGIGMATIAIGFLLLIRFRRPVNKEKFTLKSREQSEETKATPLPKKGLDDIRAVNIP